MLDYCKRSQTSVVNRDQVVAIVLAHQTELEKLGVKSLDLFGSVARNKAHPDSDVDFLVEFIQPAGYFQLLRVQYFLEKVLGRSVDLGTQNTLSEHLREPVLRDLIHVF